MSATTVGKEEGNEQDRLDRLRFKIIDSKIEKPFEPNEELKERTAEEFFDDVATNMAHLVYCKDEDLPKYQEMAEAHQLTVVRNLRSVNDLRRLNP